MIPTAERRAAIVAAAVAAGAFALYAASAQPDLGLVDSAELATAAATGSVPHPPGTPLFLIFGRIFAALPFASPVRGTNLMSAFFGAVAAGFVFLAARETVLAFRARRGGGGEDARSGSTATIAALGSAIVWTTAFNPWFWATRTEVYSLNAALFAGAWFGAARWTRARAEGEANADRALAGAIVASALGLANHHATALLAFVAVGAFVLAFDPKTIVSRRVAAWTGGALAGAAALYGVLFLAAGPDRALNWGAIDSPGALVAHVVGRQYRDQVGGAGVAFRVAGDALKGIVFGVSPLAPLAIAGGLFAMRRAGAAAGPSGGAAGAGPSGGGSSRKKRRARKTGDAPAPPDRRAFAFLAALAATLFANLLLSSAYVAGPEDRVAYDLPAHAAVALGLAPCLAAIFGVVRSRVVPALLLAALAGANLAPNLARCSGRGERFARVFAEETLAELPPDSLLVTSEWNFYAPFLYMRHVEEARPPVRVVDALLMRRFWYVDYLAREYPELVAAAPDAFARFRDQVRRFDRGLPYDDAEIARAYEELMVGWVAFGAARGGAFVDFPTLNARDEAGWIARFASIPQGMFVRLAARDPARPLVSREVAPKDPANLAALLARFGGAIDDPGAAFGPSSVEVRWWKVFEGYRQPVEATLVAAWIERGESAAAARAEKYREWYPATDEAMAATRRRLGSGKAREG